eukprot:gene20726-biopygen6905
MTESHYTSDNVVIGASALDNSQKEGRRLVKRKWFVQSGDVQSGQNTVPIRRRTVPESFDCAGGTGNIPVVHGPNTNSERRSDKDRVRIVQIRGIFSKEQIIIDNELKLIGNRCLSG